MAITCGVGFSSDNDSYNAGVRSAQQAMLQIGEAKPNCIFVFSTVAYDQEKMLAGVRSVTGSTLLVGSSTAGEITTDGPQDRHGVAVMAISAPNITFGAAVGPDIAKDVKYAGRRVAEEVKTVMGDALKLFIMMPDVLVGNGAEIVRG